MKYRNLGRTGVKVSELCLGTMTWGSQNTEAEAHEQINFALSQGINFIDTAEMYPTTPVSPETQGLTESYIGTWFEKYNRRSDVILATKITGAGLKHIRSARDISPPEITKALDASLKRLRTDYIDLYQLHWPNRGSYHFRQIWTYNPTRQNKQQTIDHICETLEALNGFIQAGKIRHIGLSNETVWGTAQFLAQSEIHDLPRIVSVQNEYSMMHRLADHDFAELMHNEDIGLLAYSPLAAGMLSGKYKDNAKPIGTRRAINETLHSRYSQRSQQVVDKYVALAKEHNVDVNQMALAFCLTRPFMTSAIIGATTMDQLTTNIGAKDLKVSQTLLKQINELHRAHPLPF